MRRLIATTLVTASMAVAAAACSGGDDGAFSTLPPVRATTTTSTTTTTENTDRIFYVIKSGEGLNIIAESFGVTVQAIAELNGITDVNNVQAGQTIEIPRGIQVVTDLPTTSAAG